MSHTVSTWDRILMFFRIKTDNLIQKNLSPQEVGAHFIQEKQEQLTSLMGATATTIGAVQRKERELEEITRERAELPGLARRVEEQRQKAERAGDSELADALQTKLEAMAGRDASLEQKATILSAAIAEGRQAAEEGRIAIETFNRSIEEARQRIDALTTRAEIAKVKKDIAMARSGLSIDAGSDALRRLTAQVERVEDEAAGLGAISGHVAQDRADQVIAQSERAGRLDALLGREDAKIIEA